MTQSMKDKVARAIYEATRVGDCPQQEYELLTTFAKGRIDAYAEAAIKAMRVPTQAMWLAYNQEATIETNWQAMIDAAAKDKP